MPENNQTVMIISTLISMLLLIIASVADGVVEGWEFDGRIFFEKKYGKSPTGFWGSQSWKNKNTWWYKITGGVWDFYHLADDVRKHFYIAPAMIFFFIAYGVNLNTIGLVLISYIITILAKRFAMDWIRT